MERLRAYMALCFVGFSIFVFGMGVRFDLSPLGIDAHYADPELLRTRLLESCFYLHVQPPLYNLALGVVLKLCPGFETQAFYALSIATGLALSLMLLTLMVRLGVSKKVSFALAALFACSPSFILFQNLLLYTLQCAMLLTASALLLHVFLAERRGWAGWGFFIALFLLGGIRSLYHLVYYIAVAAGVLALMRPFWWRYAIMALIPGLLLFSFFVKSYVLFGQFTTSSFHGKSLWAKTVGNLPSPERVKLAEAGAISKVSLVDPFSAIDDYPPEVREVAGYEDIPVLRQKTKYTGEVNYNHLSELRISELYMQDAIYGLLHYPKAFVRSTAWAVLTFCSPSRLDAPSLGWLNTLYDRAAYGKIDVTLARYIPWLGASKHVPYVFLLIGLPTLFVFGLWRTMRSATIAERGVLLFMCFTIFYVGSL
ncbi:MAG: hypothetical protein NTU83_06290, partial [Candidatus Hydrogenedentes bacterium]|nr:hypothetical protein [Candidatus Hydrogenedentota bacterium]